MTAVLRTSISLDGKLLTSSGKPLRSRIPATRITDARELEVTIHPTVIGSSAGETLSGQSGSFLPDESRWELLSAANLTNGRIVARYRRKQVRVRPA